MATSALNGQIDVLGPYRVTGWAQEPERPNRPVTLIVSNNGEVLDRIVADEFREDLRTAGFGEGLHGFEYWLPMRLSGARRNVVRVFRESDGRDLLLSPMILEATDAFGPVQQARLDELLSAPMEAPDLRARIVYFSKLLDGLRQRAGDETSGMEIRTRYRKQPATTKMPALRALVIDNGLPDPNRDAGSNAILSHIRSLMRLGYELSFVPSDLRGDGSEAEAALASEGAIVHLPPQVASVEELLRRQREGFDLVYLHRIENAARYAPLVRTYQPSAFLLYSVADLHHLRMQRQGVIEGSKAMALEAKKLRTQEFLTAWQADAILTHSTVEAALLRGDLTTAKIAVVPWAVRPNRIVRSFAQRRHVAFVGGYRHAPNIAAAQRLVEAIMPTVWRTHPDIKCMLIGSEMPDELAGLTIPGIEPIGHVPDLFLALNRCRLTVAPLTFGAGVKGKVLESMAHGVPCAMSPSAAEGMILPDALEACVADDEDFSALIIRLHEDYEFNERCSEAGLRYIEKHWSEEGVDQAMRAVLSPKQEPPPLASELHPRTTF